MTDDDFNRHLDEFLNTNGELLSAIAHSDKAQSKSDGKPQYLDIFEWLDVDFLMEMVRQMKVPVEVLKKYPKDNWKNGKGDQQFIRLRRQSGLRHLLAEQRGETEDKETGVAHEAAEACNAMMRFYCRSRNV